MAKRIPDFNWGVWEGVLWLEDLDAGSISLTNGMEAALDSLRAEFDFEPGAKFVYRDSEGVWDGVVVDSVDPILVTFFGIGASTRDSAIAHLSHE